MTTRGDRRKGSPGWMGDIMEGWNLILIVGQGNEREFSLSLGFHSQNEFLMGHTLLECRGK